MRRVDKIAFRQGRVAKADAQAAAAGRRAVPKELGEGLREIADPELRACLESLAAKLAGSRGAPAVDNIPNHLHSHHPEQMTPMKNLLSVPRLARRCSPPPATPKRARPTAAAPKSPRRRCPAPNNGDWSTVVTKTPEGGFLMGNPNAKVKLVEFGSMTCPHCAEFEEQGGKALIDNYVKKGLVSWEFRNFVRDPFDMAATLLARCGGEASFFGLTRTMFPDQKNWIGKIQAADQAQLQALQTHAAGAAILDHRRPRRAQDLRRAARRAARQGRAVPGQRGRGQPAGPDEQRRRIDLFNIPGTPSFLINGTLVDRPELGRRWNPRSRKRWPAEMTSGGSTRCVSAG